MESLTLVGGIIGVIEAIKNVDSKNYVQGWVVLIVALVLGAAAGFWHLLGTPDILTGIFIGAGAVGAHTLASATASDVAAEMK